MKKKITIFINYIFLPSGFYNVMPINNAIIKDISKWTKFKNMIENNNYKQSYNDSKNSWNEVLNDKYDFHGRDDFIINPSLLEKFKNNFGYLLDKINNIFEYFSLEINKNYSHFIVDLDEAQLLHRKTVVDLRGLNGDFSLIYKKIAKIFHNFKKAWNNVEKLNTDLNQLTMDQFYKF